MKVTVTASKNVIYDGKFYRRGESFEVDKTETGKLSTWIMENISADEKVPTEIISPADGLPPLDAPKKGKKS